MKFLRNAVVLLSSTYVSSQVQAAPCNICPDGITLDENIVSCESAIAASNMLEEGSDACSASKLTYDMMCCPAPIDNIIADATDGVNINESNPPSLGLVGIDADPCTICPEGVTISESNPSLGFVDNELSLEEAKADCEQLLSTYFTTYNADSEFCSAEIKMTYGRVCCPAPVNNPCALCPNGISVNENSLFGASLEETTTQCEQSITLLATYEDGAEFCTEETKLSTEIMCCPTPPEIPCTICPDGVSVNENYYSDETSLEEAKNECEQSIPMLATVEDGSAFCTEEAKLATQMMCCPTPLDNPCTICPNGVSLSESSLISLADSNETSLEDIMAGCEQTIASFAMFEAGSEFCPQENIELYEMSCCPAPIDDPCALCPNGISVNENNLFGASLGETTTQCEQSITLLATYEASSEVCTEETKLSTEMMCCPTPLDDPCTICPDGVSPSENSHMNESLEENIAWCEQGVTMMATFESSSEMCSDETKESYEMSCCPTPADDPCSFCDGVSLSENRVPDFGDCADVVGYAKLFESDSEFCNELKFFELFCCQTPAMDPCSICPEGYAIDEDASTYDNDDSTDDMEDVGIACGQMATNIEEGSNQCSMAKEDMDLQSKCCSALANPQPPSANSTISIKDPTNMTLPTSSPADEESSAQASSNPTIASDAATPENDSVGTGSPIMTPSDPPSNMPVSKDSSAAPTMGTLISVSLVLVTIHALAWVI